MSRYETPGPWEVTLSTSVHDGIDWYGEVTILNGPAKDTRNGHVYLHGAFKVEVRGPKGRPRAKTFIGETAWYRSDHYAADAKRWLEVERDKGRGL